MQTFPGLRAEVRLLQEVAGLSQHLASPPAPSLPCARQVRPCWRTMLALAVLIVAATAAPVRRPHVIFMLGDEVGWNNVRRLCTASERPPTLRLGY